MDIILNYVAFSGITEIDNIYLGSLKYFAPRDILTSERLSDNEKEIIDKFLTYSKESDKIAKKSDRNTWFDPLPR